MMYLEKGKLKSEIGDGFEKLKIRKRTRKVVNKLNNEDLAF